MGKAEDEDAREDWFEVMGLKWDCTEDDVKNAYKKLALKYHPDKNQGDPKAADRFVLINKAKQYLSDETKRTKLAEKKKREAERDKRNKKRFEEMDEKRKRFKGDLDAKEAAERAKASGRGRGGGVGMDDHRKPGINVHILDELRKLGQQQREEEAKRMEDMLKKAGETATAANNGRPIDAMGEDDDEDDDTSGGAGTGLGGMTGYGTSSTIKIKWKRRTQAQSHSDESLYQLFSKYGPITSVELTGAKGNAGKIVFEERSAAEKAVAEYEFNQDMRVAIPADKKYRLFQKPSFDAGKVVGSGAAPTTTSIGGLGRGLGLGRGGGGSLFGGVLGGRGGGGAGGLSLGGGRGGGGVNESDTLARMRQAAAERKARLQQQQQPAEGVGGGGAEGGATNGGSNATENGGASTITTPMVVEEDGTTTTTTEE